MHTQKGMSVKFARRLVGERFVAIACAMVLLPLVAYSQNSGRQSLKGHVQPAVARLHLQPLGRLSATKQLNLAIGLPLRNQQALDALLQQIYDPASPNYRHYLTPEQFTEQFGPTEEDYQAVIAFMESKGLTVTYRHPNRVILDVSGSVADIEKAFHVGMQVYQHPTEARMFYTPDVEPSLDLTVPILHISGLDNFIVPRPMSLKATPLNDLTKIMPASGSGPSGLYMGKDFRAAYAPGVTLDGSGQTVGLLELDGYYTSDITNYEHQAGLPNVTLTNVLVDSFSGSAGSNNVEVALDIEMAIAMAPGLSKVIVYEGPNPGLPVHILAQMASDNLAKQISSSWLMGDDPNYDVVYKEFMAQGQSFFQASGDDGAYYTGISQWADDTNITLVGGTTLTMSGTGSSYASETTWNWYITNPPHTNSSGGGISVNYTIPGWQQGINMTTNHGSTTMRNVPDVALTADNIYVIADNGGQYFVGGTSAAAPLWAGFAALVNQQAVANGGATHTIGFINPVIYAIGKSANYTADFHDITTGNNTNLVSHINFSAVPGYDLCTGWGTPAGQNLINTFVPPDVLGISPLLGFNSYGAIGGPFTITSQTFTLTNSGTASFNWNLVNTSSWLNVSSTSGTLVAGGQTAVTVELNSAANNLVEGTYTATLWFTNQTSGVSQNRQFTLQVVQPLVITPATGFTAVGLAGGPFDVTSRIFSLTNIGTASFNWNLVNTSPWLNVSSTGGTLAVGGQTAVTVGLNLVASNLTKGIYTATLWFTNQTSGTAQSRQFTLQVAFLTDGFEGLAAANFSAGQTMGNWMVLTNQVSIVTDSTNASEGSNFLALANGTISRTLPTVAGHIYTLSIDYRGPGIAGMWRGETNGNDSIYGNNGTLQNVTFTPGKVGQAFTFNPEYDITVGVCIPDQPAYVLTNSLSIEGWVRWRGDASTIFYRGDKRPGYDPYSLTMNGGNIAFFISDNPDNQPTIQAPLVSNQWSHVAGTLNGNSGAMMLYVNGIVVAQTNTTTRPIGNLISTDHPGVGIGNINDGHFYRPFEGDLDEISLYSRALSASEVGAIYNAGSAGKFDPAASFPQNLAEAAFTVDGTPMGVISGNNTNWQTLTITFTAKQDGTLLQIQGIEPGMLLDNLLLSEVFTLVITPTSGFAATGPVGGPFNITAQNFSLTNAGTASLNWSLINTSSWLNASPGSGTLAVGGQTNVTVSLNSVASNLTAGSYTANIWFTNQTAGIAQSRQFTLQVFDSLVVTPTNGFAATGPVGGPFNVTSQDYLLNNISSVSQNWSVINTSSWLSTSSSGGTLAGFGQTNVTVSLNSTASNLTVGSYTANIWFTNQTTGVAQSRQFNLLIGGTIQNGGFETGDFSYWTLWGDINTAFVYGGFYGSVTHSGNYGALLSTTGSLGHISQTVVTVPGQKYLLSLWFNNTVNPAPGHPATPNEFSVVWDGTTLFDQVNMPVTGMLIGWTNLQFVVTATASSSVLQFGFRNDPWHFGLDDVSLWPWPIVTPSFQSITQSTNTVWLGWTALPGLPYQMQYKTNLLQPNWINLGSIVTATNATMTIPDVIGPDPQRFYRIEWVPAY